MSLRKRLRVGLVATTLLAIVASVLVTGPQSAQALTGSQFDPGYIVSDAVFFNKNAMTEAQIQAFLEARLPTCAEANGIKCLKNYTQTTVDRAASPAGNCAFYQGAANERASRIIFKVAQACGINPQVILVTLQKEQGLITSGSPSAPAIQAAMGYGCPDTAACDTRYYGLYNQIYSAAWQFKQYGINAQRWNYHIGSVFVNYSPTAGCGGTVVNIRNQATANLYNYTPYQPDAPALNNLGGLGVKPCSSYGNRNFWVYFNNWFGSPTGPVDPAAFVESVMAVPGGVALSGWAFDYNDKAPIEVHVYVNGVGVRVTADLARADLPKVFGDIGDNHGFAVTIPVTSGGAQTVCVYAINVGPGSNTPLPCSTVTGQSGSPRGVVDNVTAKSGTIDIFGWALDPDTAEATSVHLYVDNVGLAVAANKQRNDIAAAFPGYGANHGFSETLTAAAGAHNVCAFAINIGVGATTPLGCTSVVVPGTATTIPELGRAPVGIIDTFAVSETGYTVSGWALDPDTAAPIQIHAYVDSFSAAYMADTSRPDIATAFPAYGDKHGFGLNLSASPGSHRVCIYAINTGAGGHPLLGCRTATVPYPAGSLPELGRSPFGNFESAAATPGSLSVSGWVIDPDSASSTSVHVYVDGVGVAFAADKARGDVGAAYPGYGANHGFAETVAATPGSHTVCIYGINLGPGPHTLMGCRTVSVP